MQNVAEVLMQLQATRGIDLELLQSDEAFIDVVMQATQIASRNHQQEKREALRNAIANSVGPHAPEESKRQMFLQFIDRFTVWHIKFLNFFADPKGQLGRYTALRPIGLKSGAVLEAIEIVFSEMRGQREFYEQIWNDIRVVGLVLTSPPPGIVTFQAPGLTKQTTALGDEFLGFINSPKTQPSNP
jgi:hypothetical protein